MRNFWILFGLVCILVLVSMFAITVGTVSLPLEETISLLLGFSSPTQTSSHSTILFQVRLPRVCAGILAGYGLAIAGCVMQGVFRNPLAEPYLLGIAGGATSGAALCISLGLASLPFVLPLGAFGGGMFAVVLVFSLSQGRRGRLSNATLILVGIAVGAMFGSLTSFLTFFSGNEQLQQIVFWTMGDLGALTWSQMPILLGITILCNVVILMFVRELDGLTLGDEMAQHLGLAPRKIKQTLLGITTLLTAAIVAVTGTIGFVGLITPHAMRLLCGPHHRLLLPASGLAGAIFLVASDAVARTIMHPHELPVGLITALCGAPFFLYLLKSKANAYD